MSLVRLRSRARHLRDADIESALGAHAAQEMVNAIARGDLSPRHGYWTLLQLIDVYGSRSPSVDAYVTELAKLAGRR